MRSLILLLCFAVTARAQVLRWTAPLPEPTFIADAGAFFTACQGDAAGTVAVLLSYNKVDGPSQPTSGHKLFWFTNLGKPIHTDEFLAENVSDFRILNVSATVLILAIYDADGNLTVRKYTKRYTGITVADTALPGHEMIPLPSQMDRGGFFVCEKVNNRPAFLKRYSR
jgi:hypothetical protein